MRYPTPLFPIIVAKLLGGGGSVSPESVLAAMEGMSDAQAEDARAAIGADDLFIVNVDEASTPITADKTFAEVQAAIAAGKTVVYVSAIFQAATIGSDANKIKATGIIEGDYISLVTLTHNSSGVTATQTAISPAPTTVTDLTSTSVTLSSAADNTEYSYGELSALTVTAITATGDFIIRFTSGATATTTNFPASMVFPEAFAAEANTRYEINVSDGYALVAGWPTA